MSCNEWKVKKLNEVADIIDSLHKTPKYTESGFPMIRVKDMESGFLKINNPAYVSKEVFDEFNRKHKPKRSDILMSRVGSYGIVTYVNTDAKFCLGQNTVIITNHKFDIDSRFLYYVLRSEIISKQIEQLVTGSTQKTISMASIKSLDIPIPNLMEQKSIANILWSIDNKIELNNEMNKTLEEMAQALFKRWFVDFEFPNEEGKPYKSSGGEMVESEMGMIPKGWNVNTLNSISDNISKGTTPTVKDLEQAEDLVRVNFLKVKDINDNGLINLDDIQRIPESIHLGKLKRSILKENDILFSIAGTIGRVAYINKEILECNINQAIAYIRLKDCHKYFNLVLYNLKSSRVNNEIKSKVVQGVQANISLGVMKDIKLVIPEDIVLDKFNKLTNPIVKNIRAIQEENNQLIQLRDSLLPKLISGKIRVNDIGANLL